MTIEQLFHTVENGVFRLGKRLWKDDPQAHLHREADQLNDDLQERGEILKRNRAKRKALEQRVADGEIKAAMTISRVETYVHINDPANAWNHALELDHIREALKHNRAQLRLQEETCRRQHAHLQQLEGRLASLMEMLFPR